MIRAVLWDVDGTLAETERDGHRIAFNQAFATAGVPWRWSEGRYGELLGVAGGRERLLHDMQTQAAAPATAHERGSLAAHLHQLKNQHYAAIVSRGELPLRAGVAALLDDCRKDATRLAIVTTTSRCNVEALLVRQLGEAWVALFAAVVCAEDAPRKKPDPQAYELALARLGVPAHATVAIEDSAAGVEAARGAQVPVVLTRSHYFSAAPAAPVLACGPSLGEVRGWQPQVQLPATRVTLAQIALWHRTGAAGRAPRH
jgi:HAD superfamily hydrolase (TIGR01509 family)